MPEFQYKARDSQGTNHAGSVTAASKNLAVSQLRERGWVVLGLDSETSPRGIDAMGSELWKRLPPRAVNVEISLQQLAMMMRSGMTLLAAIDSVVEQSSGASLKRIWRDVSSQIQAGKGMSVAMQRHSCFPEFVVRLAKVGEETGNLDAVLGRAAQTMRERRDAKESIVSATIYPLLILVMALGVTAYMVVYLIPRLENYLQSLGKDLPAMTQGLIDGSFWLRDNYPILAIALVAIPTAIWMFYVSPEGRVVVDRLLLRVPMLGRLLRLGETSTFARSLSMMLKSGVTLTEGLGSVEKIVGNRYLRRAISDARENIIRGGSLADAFKQKGAFSPMLAKMAAVGQETGELDRVLDEVALLQDSQFKSLVKRLNAILTPLLTIIIGGVVGYVYIAFFMALVAASA